MSVGAPRSSPRARAVFRAVALVVLSFGLLLALPEPASAHGRGSDATNYESRVTAQPEIPGAVWRVHGGDELLELDSPAQEVLVLGYSGEPYLRVGPDGVFENQRSPATYLNQDRYQTELPPGASADADAQPQWELVSTGTSFAWHDHRIHMMTTALPAQVAADPDAARLVQEWSVPVVASAGEAAVEGELRWIPGPSPWPWVLVALVAVAPALVGVRSADLQRLVRPAALVLGAVGLLNVTRVFDDLFAMPLPVSTALLAAVQTGLFLVIGMLGAAKAWRGGDGAFTALAVGSAAILVGQGLLYLPVLSASQLTSLFPDGLGRFLVAVSITQAATVGFVAVIGNRRMMPEVADQAEGTVART